MSEMIFYHVNAHHFSRGNCVVGQAACCIDINKKVQKKEAHLWIDNASVAF